MNRLLFAAGRGARIEQYRKGYKEWISAETLPVQNFKFFNERRIHPDDLHLQYGPISTALRERAATNKETSALAVIGTKK